MSVCLSAQLVSVIVTKLSAEHVRASALSFTLTLYRLGHLESRSSLAFKYYVPKSNLLLKYRVSQSLIDCLDRKELQTNKTVAQPPNLAIV